MSRRSFFPRYYPPKQLACLYWQLARPATRTTPSTTATIVDPVQLVRTEALLQPVNWHHKGPVLWSVQNHPNHISNLINSSVKMCLSISSAHLGVQQKGRNLINTIFAMCNLKTAFRHNRAYVTWLWHKTVMDFKHTGQTCPLPPQSLPPRQSSIQVASASISSADSFACWLQLICRSLIANAQIGSLIAVDLPRRACHTTFQRASPCHATTPNKSLRHCIETDQQCFVTNRVQTWKSNILQILHFKLRLFANNKTA